MANVTDRQKSSIAKERPMPGSEPLFVPEKFVSALRGGRVLQGYTVGQVSRGTGIPTWRIRAFEAGLQPSVEEFAQLWDFLSTDPKRPESEPGR
jgi:hypothetical protein